MSEKTEMPIPEFKDGQFVKRAKGNSTGGSGIVRILGESIWNERDKQYWYGIGYRNPVHEKNEMSPSGGSSYSWPESDFVEVDDPIDLLIIAKFEREEEMREATSRIAVLNDEIKKIQFSFNLSNPINTRGDDEDGR